MQSYGRIEIDLHSFLVSFQLNMMFLFRLTSFINKMMAKSKPLKTSVRVAD